VKAPDGKISFPFGESPKGMLVFTPDGRFMQIHVASDLPRIAANNRLKGTPEEYAEIMRRSISVFGTYSVDDAKKTVTYHVVSAFFPNWQGESQTRTIDKLTADEFINTNPNVAGGRGSASNFYKRAKQGAAPLRGRAVVQVRRAFAWHARGGMILVVRIARGFACRVNSKSSRRRR